MRSSKLFVLLIWAACGAPEQATPDAAPVVLDGAAPVATCGGRPLVFSRTETEADAAFASLLADVRVGAPQAYLREAISGTQANAIVTAIGAPLDVALDADPRPAAVGWLAAASSATITAAEWAPDPLAGPIDPAAIAIGDVMVAQLVRTEVAGEPWPSSYPTRWVEGGGMRLLIAKRADGWVLREATLVPQSVLATRADAELLAACAPTEPRPEASLRGRTYSGIELEGCAEVGSYTYRLGDADTTRWVPGLGFALAAPSDGRAGWHAFAQVELTIAAANYWPRIAYADCLCDGVAGFTLRVDIVTGEVLGVQPGINCVVC